MVWYPVEEGVVSWGADLEAGTLPHIIYQPCGDPVNADEISTWSTIDPPLEPSLKSGCEGRQYRSPVLNLRALGGEPRSADSMT